MMLSKRGRSALAAAAMAVGGMLAMPGESAQAAPFAPAPAETLAADGNVTTVWHGWGRHHHHGWGGGYRRRGWHHHHHHRGWGWGRRHHWGHHHHRGWRHRW